MAIQYTVVETISPNFVPFSDLVRTSGITRNMIVAVVQDNNVPVERLSNAVCAPYHVDPDVVIPLVVARKARLREDRIARGKILGEAVRARLAAKNAESDVASEDGVPA